VKAFVFIDEDERTIEDGNFGARSYPSGDWAIAREAVTRVAPCLFAEGHVEYWKWPVFLAFFKPERAAR